MSFAHALFAFVFGLGWPAPLLDEALVHVAGTVGDAIQRYIDISDAYWKKQEAILKQSDGTLVEDPERIFRVPL
jgi:hypothetical protein